MARRHVRAELGRQRVTIEVELGECLTDDARLLEGAELGVDEHHEHALDTTQASLAGERVLEALEPDGDAGTRGDRRECEKGLFGAHPGMLAPRGHHGAEWERPADPRLDGAPRGQRVAPDGAVCGL